MEDHRPRLLIVEDGELMRGRFANIMRNPAWEWVKNSPVPAFQVETVGSAEEARALWRKAREEERPFEIVLLDLHLPGLSADLSDSIPSEQNGRDLLAEFRRDSNAAIVIHTGYWSTENLIHAVRHDATDFVCKVDKRDAEQELFDRLLNALGKVSQTIGQDLEREREAWIERQARKEDRERTARVLSANMGRLTESARLVTESLRRRYGLDPQRDREDPICRELKTVEQTASGVVDEISRLFPADAEGFHLDPVDVAQTLRKEITRVRPSYHFHNVRLQVAISEALRTRTFERDLGLMIDELLLGTLARFRDNGLCPPEKRVVGVSCALSEDQQDIVMSLTYPAALETEDAAPAPADSTEAAEEGQTQGLALVRRIAGNVGARVVQDIRGDQAVVDLLIPVISNG